MSLLVQCNSGPAADSPQRHSCPSVWQWSTGAASDWALEWGIQYRPRDCYFLTGGGKKSQENVIRIARRQISTEAISLPRPKDLGFVTSIQLSTWTWPGAITQAEEEVWLRVSAKFKKKPKTAAIRKKARRFMSKQNQLFHIFVAEERYKQQAFGMWGEGCLVTLKHSHANNSK